jgi:hypothetical protein
MIKGVWEIVRGLEQEVARNEMEQNTLKSALLSYEKDHKLLKAQLEKIIERNARAGCPPLLDNIRERCEEDDRVYNKGRCEQHWMEWLEGDDRNDE